MRLCDELVQSALIQVAALRLVNRGLVRMQAASCKLLQDDLVCTRYTARRVNVFNAYQPLATMRFGIQPAGQCCDQRACMQRACGRRCKATYVA